MADPRPLLCVALVCLVPACAAPPEKSVAELAPNAARSPVRDVHSLSNPADVQVVHADLDWTIDFEARVLAGTVTWTVERRNPAANELILDTKHLSIAGVRAGTKAALHERTHHTLPLHDVFGTALVVPLLPGEDRVEVAYHTTDQGTGLQWLVAAQTASGAPFLFSQAQAIHARTILPCQDSPGVRFTYTARVRATEGHLAVMAARQLGTDANDRRVFRFEMPQPIPSYLVAIAVGHLEFQALSPRAGVYAEPSVLKRAAYEFADTEQMIEKAEALYGPYRWERYDIIVLPPSFPFGGMENPRLTFATPTVLAGDRSLVALVAHELAHSWSGNLVTNATWSDFWLNEGFTVYFERRIQESVFGRARAEMEAVLGRTELIEEMNGLPASDTILKVNLDGRDPDDAFSNVPYEKGYLFLRHLEETFGRRAFDGCLRSWFDGNAFQSRTTEDFVAHLNATIFKDEPKLAAKIDLRTWLHDSGLPTFAPEAQSDAFDNAALAAEDFASARIAAEALPGRTWTTHEWLHFLKSLPSPLDATRMSALDTAWKLTDSGNSEVLQQWLLMSLRSRYAAADGALDRFLTSQGRRKYLKPLYSELAKTPEGLERARKIYERARPMYHPIATNTIDGILK